MKKLAQIALTMAFVCGLIAPTQVQAQEWVSDPGHSSVLYSVRHILTPFLGNFDTYQVDLTFDPDDIKNAEVKVTIDPASVNSSSEQRDAHLKGEDFFDVENYPDPWTFVSTSFKKVGEGEYIAKGKLSVKDVTKKFEVPFKFLGTMETKFGLKSGITVELDLKRSDFNLGGDAGGMLGDDVTIMAFLEMNAKK